jgi:phosphinothricin acetyltransferase
MTAPVEPSIVIRQASDADLPQLTTIYNHYIQHSVATFDVKPFTVEKRRAEWFSHYAQTGRYRIFVAEQRGAVLAFTYSSQFRRKAAYDSSVETSVYCAPGQTGNGLGRRLYAALFDALRVEGVHQAFALISLPNDASEKFHARFGFQQSGVMRAAGRKFDRYVDVAVFQRAVEASRVEPT